MPDRDIADLLKRATAQAGANDYDAAIASLRTAYALMETVTIEWPVNTLFRLGRYLHLSGRYAEAVDWLQYLHDTVDERRDARDRLKKSCGLRGRKTPKKLREVERQIILEEIALYAKRQAKIEQKSSL